MQLKDYPTVTLTIYIDKNLFEELISTITNNSISSFFNFNDGTDFVIYKGLFNFFREYYDIGINIVVYSATLNNFK